MALRTAMIAWKEFLHLLRDWRTLAVVVALPVLMLVLYGYALNLDVTHIRLAVYDQDRSAPSRRLTDAFVRSGYFRTVSFLSSYDQATESLDGGAARVVLVIPTGYAGDLASGRQAQVQLLVDGSDSTTASTAIGYANALLQQQSVDVAAKALSRRGLGARAMAPLDVRTRYWYNPELRSTNFIVPGLIAVILMMLAGLLTSMTIVRERERGTIEQLIVSPVMPGELMLGKLLPYVLIALFDVLLVITMGRLVFHVPLVGSPALVLALSGVFITAALGIGLLVSVVSTSQQAAMTAALMVTLLPSIMLSGFVFPITSMPVPIQWITTLIPARHFLTILRAIFLKGVGLGLLWKPALILVIYGAAALALSARRFRKTL
jgi:ABC-2 type transport system permease protein